MKRLSIFLIWIFFVTCLTAQKTEWLPTRPYEPMVFDSLQPIWYHTFYDPKGIGGDTCDGYNFVEFIYYIDPLVVGDYLYVAVGTRNTKDLNTGALIEKRRLSDGELVWQSSLTYPEVGRQEVPRLMRTIDNDKLEVLCLKRNKPFNEPDPYYLGKSGVSYDMALSRRVYSSEDGKIISYAEISDTSSAEIKYTYSWGESIGTSNIFEYNGEFLYTGLFSKAGKVSYVLHYLKNGAGNIISDTFSISGIQRGNNIAKINDDTIIIIEEVFNKPTLLHFFNKDLNLIKTIETEKLDFPRESKLIRANNDGLLLECLEKKELTQITYQLVVMDFNGKIRKKVSFENENTYHRIYEVLDWNINGEILLMSKKYVKEPLENPLPNINYDVSQALDFWYATADSDLHRIKRYKSTDVKRYALPYVQKSVKLDNGDFVVFLLESAIDTISLKSGGFENDFDARASSIMRITPQQAGLKVNGVKETSSIPFDYRLYPNPAKDVIHIDLGADRAENVSVSDIFGKVFYPEIHIVVSSAGNGIEMSVQDWVPGLYFITISNGKHLTTLKVLVEGR
jgi:hypothetical protein